MLRLWLMAMLAAVVLVAVKDHDLLHRSGLLGHCTTTRTPPGAKGTWRACNTGVIGGRPSLAGESCRREGRSGSVQYWSCPPRVRAKAMR